MYDTKALRIILWRYTPSVFTPPPLSLTPKELLFNLPTPCFAWKKVKTPLRPCQMCGEGWKTLQATKLLYYCVCCKIVTRCAAKWSKSVWSKWSVTVALYIFCFSICTSPTTQLRELAPLKRIACLKFFYFYQISLECIAAEIWEHKGYGWNSLHISICMYFIYK